MEHKALISDYETAVSCARELNLSAEELASISSIGAGDTNHGTNEECCKIYGETIGILNSYYRITNRDAERIVKIAVNLSRVDTDMGNSIRG